MDKNVFKFKINNPYKPDEILEQEVLLSNSLQYDYSNTDWIAVDAEFLGLNLYRDALCSIQISSADPDKKERQRVEIVHVYNQNPDKKLGALFNSDKLKIFHVFSSDLAMLSKYFGKSVVGPFFDTKIATKIAWTNSNKFSKTELIKTFIDPKYDSQEYSNARWELNVSKWNPKMVKYASMDVLYLHPIMNKLKDMAKERNRLELVQTAMEAIPLLSKLYSNGFDVDVFKF